MTANRDFKRLVRARARKTGESYTAALRHLREHGERTVQHQDPARADDAKPNPFIVWDELATSERRLAEVRGVLAPLLDQPYFVRRVVDGDERNECGFCAQAPGDAHADGCPVLRKDELLGRRRPEGVRVMVARVPGGELQVHLDGG
jgi:hypothetical protein